MLKRQLAIAGFHTRVYLAKTFIYALAMPILMVMIPLWIMRDEAEWKDFRALFNPTEWHECLGEICEAFVGCRWYIIGGKAIDQNKFLPYTYYDCEDDLLCCLFLDDAVTMNMLFGGRLTKSPFSKAEK
jgi:hypothetical protein